ARVDRFRACRHPRQHSDLAGLGRAGRQRRHAASGHADARCAVAIRKLLGGTVRLVGGGISLAAYIATIWAANWAIVTYGVVPIGFGLVAPAGVLFAGFAFTARDAVHETLGARWSIAAIVAGAALSAFLSPALAVASGSAFLVSELADLGVYAPLRRDHKLAALVLSNTVGAAVDSALFLSLA